MICIGDLHIKSKGSNGFEEIRLAALIEHLERTWEGKNEDLALLGDIFDSNSPTLGDIRYFYSFIESLNKVFLNIYVICGNHDFKVFDYLPEIGFTYFKEPTSIDGFLFVPWTHLDHIISRTKQLAAANNILLTHARCTIEPFIVEETNILSFSEHFENVVLGDIHMPYSPYGNVFYASEPTQNSYKTYKDKSTGYIHIDGNGTINRVFTDLPRKEKLAACTMEDLEKILPSLPTNNYYKIPVADLMSNLKRLKQHSYKNILFEPKPIIVQKDDKDSSEIKAFVEGRISIEQVLFEHITEKYKFKTDIADQISRGIR